MKIKKYINSVFDKVRNAIIVSKRKKLFTTLTDFDFTMRRYIQLVVDKDLEVLKKKKVRVSRNMLVSVYNELMAEYAKLTDSEKVNSEIDQKNAYIALIKKQNIYVMALNVLQVIPNDENTLEFLRKKARLKGDDMVERLKNEIAILNLRIAEQEKTVYPNGKENKPEGVKREDYIQMMGVLNKNGYKSDLDMTVIDFIEANRLFKKECEANEKQLRELKSRK